MQEYTGDALKARQELEKAGFRFSRALGQNFLLDDGWNARIAALSGVREGDHVLEVGPGAGTLTAALARTGAQVLAVEIDRGLEPVLRTMLAPYPNVTVLYGDVLREDIAALVDGAFGAGAAYRIVSNLPYAIVSELLPAVVSGTRPPEDILAMVQKEAAERICAVPGDKTWCALAARMQFFCACEIVALLPAHAFTPNAHVESALLRCRRYRPEERPAHPRDTALFLACLDAAFAMRRKTYANNLTAAFSLPREAALDALEGAGLSAAVRGEALSLEEIARVAGALSERRVSCPGR